jgi:hypothetical protein
MFDRGPAIGLFPLLFLVLFPVLFLMPACTTTFESPGPTEVVGAIVDSTGYPSVLRHSRPYILAPQSRLYEGDVITTDNQSLVYLTLGNNTVIKLGCESQLLITEFQAGEDTDSSFARVTLSRGSMELGRRDNGSRPTGANEIEISTSIALVSTTSETLWLGYTKKNTSLDVVSLGSEIVNVSNRDGKVALASPYMASTTIAGSAPRTAITWSQKKFNDAIDSATSIYRGTR